MIDNGPIWKKYDWDIWDPELEPIPAQSSKCRKISICTTCMDRLEDLKCTLPKNIDDNKDYPNVEFLVLDYNSSDGLADWLLKDMIGYIRSGILTCYRTEEPKCYDMAHSRNMAFKLASGEIVNNVDADNYTNEGFADILNKMAGICPEKAVFAKGKRMMHGRIGFYKSEFLSIGGYDEDLIGYGFDDHNLVYRAMALGYKLMWWGGQYCSRIKTSGAKKVSHFENKNWRQTEKINKKITSNKLENKEYIANKIQGFGVGHVIPIK